jgi:hypothetical protein
LLSPHAMFLRQLLGQLTDPGVPAVKGSTDDRGGELGLHSQVGLKLGGKRASSLEEPLALSLLVSLLGHTPAALRGAEPLRPADGEDWLPAAETPAGSKCPLEGHPAREVSMVGFLRLDMRQGLIDRASCDNPGSGESASTAQALSGSL